MYCNKCGLISDNAMLFSKDSSRKFGYKNWCKECISVSAKKNRIQNLEKYKAHLKARYQKDKANGIISRRKIDDPIRFRAHELRHGMVNRQRINGLEFDGEYFTSYTITKTLIEQRICLCCKVEFDYTISDGQKNQRTPSADRLVNEIGYTKANVVFLCWRCNRLKNDFTVPELETVVNWLEDKLEMNMQKKNVHVTPREKGWAVKSEGADKASKVVDTKQEAVKIARGIAKSRGSELVVHNADGKIANKDSHGGDPCPPKDKR